MSTLLSRLCVNTTYRVKMDVVDGGHTLISRSDSDDCTCLHEISSLLTDRGVLGEFGCQDLASS
jgi:hypothetical protein